jgi:hypothetical protein
MAAAKKGKTAKSGSAKEAIDRSRPETNSGFVLTIEDDDENVPDWDENEFDEEEGLQIEEEKPTKKPSKKSKKNLDEANKDIDPTFEFALEDNETTAFDGWDFSINE